MGNAHVDLGWSRLIKLEQQFPAQGQNLRAEEDFLRVHLESVPGRTDGFSACTIERLRFRQQSEESSEPQSGSNPPPYTRQALSDCATPARVPPRFARAQPVMMWARFEAELVGPGWFRSRRRWRSPQTREFFADAASAALLGTQHHQRSRTVLPRLEVKIVAPTAVDECDSPSAFHANGTWQNLVFSSLCDFETGHADD